MLRRTLSSNCTQRRPFSWTWSRTSTSYVAIRLVCAPLPIAGLDACPMRVVTIIDNLQESKHHALRPSADDRRRSPGGFTRDGLYPSAIRLMPAHSARDPGGLVFYSGSG